MRDEILTYLDSQDLGSYALSQELPFSSSDIELYIKNPKRIYVDKDQVTEEVFIALLDSISIDQEVTSVTIYFSNDAKTLPSDYDAVVDVVRSAKELYIANGFFKRDVQIDTEYINDLMVTKIDIRFIKLLT